DCYNATDVAEAGPAMGESKADLCAAVIKCGRDKGCSDTACYGLLSPGPCRTEIEAAAESTRTDDVLERSADTNYAVGRAKAVSTCATDNCAEACTVAPAE